MNYYELLNTKLGSRRLVGISKPEEDRIGLRVRDSYFDSFMDINSKFEMKLWFSDFEKRQLEDPGFCAVHTWRGNILLDPPLGGQPWGFMIVIDAALKEVISKFNLPSHRFYPVTVQNMDTREKREYVILQITFDKYKELYYPEVSFVEIKGNQILNTIEPGVIKSFEEYDRRLGLLVENDSRLALRPKNILFQRYFDIVWGDSGEMLFSEAIKSAIDKTNPKEVFFEAYKQIIEFKN